MEIKVVKFSDIMKHPTNRLDPGYWIGKSQGKRAYKKLTGGLLELDDTSSEIMLTKEDADTYNSLIKDKTEVENKLKQFKLTPIAKAWI